MQSSSTQQNAAIEIRQYKDGNFMVMGYCLFRNNGKEALVDVKTGTLYSFTNTHHANSFKNDLLAESRHRTVVRHVTSLERVFAGEIFSLPIYGDLELRWEPVDVIAEFTCLHPRVHMVITKRLKEAYLITNGDVDPTGESMGAPEWTNDIEVTCQDCGYEHTGTLYDAVPKWVKNLYNLIWEQVEQPK